MKRSCVETPCFRIIVERITTSVGICSLTESVPPVVALDFVYLVYLVRLVYLVYLGRPWCEVVTREF